MNDPIDLILDAYSPILSINESCISEIGKSIPIPQFESNLIKDLCLNTIELLKTQPCLMRVESPVYVIGDLHGNLFDLIRILVYARSPPYSKFVFLGDYVDRGEYSVEVITLLFALFCRYPDNIVLLRGNHEFENVNTNYGFQSEVDFTFPTKEVFFEINSVFEWLPVCAIISETMFCVHGGISPLIHSIKTLESIEKPIVSYNDELVSDMLWSDPSSSSVFFIRSARGLGVSYGRHAITEFLRKTGLKHIFRAHQCVPHGIERYFGNLVYTVFSCSNYGSTAGNRCGIVYVTQTQEIRSFSLPPIPVASRSMNSFAKVKAEKITMPSSMNHLLHSQDIVKIYTSRGKHNIYLRSKSALKTFINGLYQVLPPMKE